MKNSRRRKVTERFGNQATMEANSELDSLSDGSSDDPPKKRSKYRRDVKTVKRSKLNENSNNNITEFPNFNHLVSKIDKASQPDLNLQTNSNATTNKCDEMNSIVVCSQSKDKSLASNSILLNSEATTSNAPSSEVSTEKNMISTDNEKAAHHVDCLSMFDYNAILNQLTDTNRSLMNLHAKTDELLARMATCESWVVANMSGKQRKHQLENEYQKHEAFIRSLGVPFVRLQDLEIFEKNLDDSNFMAAVVCFYYKIFFHFQRYNNSTKFDDFCSTMQCTNIEYRSCKYPRSKQRISKWISCKNFEEICFCNN